jgi:hypothetical protein
MLRTVLVVAAVTSGATRLCFADGFPAIDVNDPGWQFASSIEHTQFGWLAKGGCKGAGSARRDIALGTGRYRISIGHLNTECRQLAKAIVSAGPDATVDVDPPISVRTFQEANSTAYVVPLAADARGGDTTFALTIARPTSVELMVAIEGGLHCWGYTLVERITIWPEAARPHQPGPRRRKKSH